jgi:ArsR family transcriptional regulator
VKPDARCRTKCEPDAIQPDNRSDDEAVAAFAWAVAHPVRVQLLKLLISRESCVCGELVEEFDLAQSTVSQHLKILKEAGLICGDIDGPKVCYCVNAASLKRFKRLVSSF